MGRGKWGKGSGEWGMGEKNKVKELVKMSLPRQILTAKQVNKLKPIGDDLSPKLNAY